MKIQLALLSLSMSLLGLAPRGQGQPSPPLKLIETIPVPGVRGALDHMGIDLRRQRLFVPAELQGTVEVLDLKTRKWIRTISDIQRPDTVVYRPQTDEIFVTDHSGSIKVYSAETYELVRTVKLIPGPDNATFDPATQYFYVVTGGRSMGMPYALIAIVDTATSQHLRDIRVDGANTQALAIETGAGSRKMYADIADKDQIAVIDLQKGAVLTTWATSPECQSPEAAAVDTAHHRLFVGCRMFQDQPQLPGRMIVMDTDTGKIVAVFPAVGGSDEMFFDPQSQRIYLQGYPGIADVWREVDPDHYEAIGSIQGGVNGKTSLLVPELRRYYVAVSRHQDVVEGVEGGNIEEGYVEVYEVEP